MPAGMAAAAARLGAGWRRRAALLLAPALAGCSLWNRFLNGAWMGPETVDIRTIAVAAGFTERKGSGGLNLSGEGISIEARTGLLAQDAARGAGKIIEGSGSLRLAKIPESAYQLSRPGWGKAQPLPSDVVKSIAASKADAYLFLWAEEGSLQGKEGVEVAAILYAKDGTAIWRHSNFANKPMSELGSGFGMGMSSKQVGALAGEGMGRALVRTLGGRSKR